MNIKRSFRTLIMLLLTVVILFGLASCRLPASKGPQTEGTSGEEFPVPGEGGQATTEPDFTTYATQTARVSLPVVISPEQTQQSPTQGSASPAATSVPGSPEPTPTELVYVQPTPGAPPATYTLQSGEYPFCIARRFNVNQAELLELNDLDMDTLVSPGTELKIPQTGTPFEGSRVLHEHPTTYKIEDGDTLNRIACYFGDVSPDMIYLQNDLHSTDLPVGEVLIIP